MFGKDKVTSGAASDIEQATKLAAQMVTRWGFSDELGTVAYGENQEEVFLGHSVSRKQNISEATAQKIDAEVRRLVDEGYVAAKRILTKKKKDMESSPRACSNTRRCPARRSRDLLIGKPPVRDVRDEPAARATVVPSAGKGRPRPGARRRAWSRSPGLIAAER